MTPRVDTGSLVDDVADVDSAPAHSGWPTRTPWKGDGTARDNRVDGDEGSIVTTAALNTMRHSFRGVRPSHNLAGGTLIVAIERGI